MKPYVKPQITELVQRSVAQELADALEWIAKRWDSCKPTHEVAMDAYDMSCEAKMALAKWERT